jgi:excisionase family DNA binding protein
MQNDYGQGLALNTDIAAVILGISPRTLRRLALNHEIGHHRVGKRGLIRFQMGDLTDYMKKTRVEVSA